jgi:hypothetical protein
MNQTGGFMNATKKYLSNLYKTTRWCGCTRKTMSSKTKLSPKKRKNQKRKTKKKVASK